MSKLHAAAAVFLVSLTIGSCTSDHPAGPGDPATRYVPSDSARAHFLLDATDFAVEYLKRTGNPDTASVRVPEVTVNMYLVPLCRLFDSRREFPLLDSLIIALRIHKQMISSSSLLVKADTSYAWVRNIGIQLLPTGEATVDSLANLYALAFMPLQSWPYGMHGWFYTRQPPLNTYALAEAFGTIPGVIETEPNSIYDSVTKLEVEPSTPETIVRFSQGYGDCPSGCFGYEHWTFSVSENYVVEYRGYIHD